MTPEHREEWLKERAAFIEEACHVGPEIARRMAEHELAQREKPKTQGRMF